MTQIAGISENSEIRVQSHGNDPCDFEEQQNRVCTSEASLYQVTASIFFLKRFQIDIVTQLATLQHRDNLRLVACLHLPGRLFQVYSTSSRGTTFKKQIICRVHGAAFEYSSGYYSSNPIAPRCVDLNNGTAFLARYSYQGQSAVVSSQPSPFNQG